MCIALLSTAHPEYPFILIDNRDEFLDRPTAQAEWWEPPHHYVLGGRDLQRAEKGTWLGITKQGRVAVLTNFREEHTPVNKAKSRGGIVNSFLKTHPDSTESTEEFVHRMVHDTGLHDVGGFSLWCGVIRPGTNGVRSGLAVISNRTVSSEEVRKIGTSQGETHGLSNSHFGDLTWPKVVHGEKFLRQAIEGNIQRGDDEATFIESLFDVLSIDTLPRPKEGEAWDVYVRQMRSSIFIPPVGGDTLVDKPGDAVASGTTAQGPEAKAGTALYGTHQQTVILVRKNGTVKFVEKTLYDHEAKPISPEQQQRAYEFQIENWS